MRACGADHRVVAAGASFPPSPQLPIPRLGDRSDSWPSSVWSAGPTSTTTINLFNSNEEFIHRSPSSICGSGRSCEWDAHALGVDQARLDMTAAVGLNAGRTPSFT